MKIITVSEQPINAIQGLKQFQEKMAKQGNNEVSYLRHIPEERKDIIAEIKAFHPDLLITTDLAGFEQCTLTDNISYNLLDCKQLHLLLRENLPNEPYLAKQLSIAMFFYCAGDEYREYLVRKYPNLPSLKSLPTGQAGSRDAEDFYEAFQEVLRECKLP